MSFNNIYCVLSKFVWHKTIHVYTKVKKYCTDAHINALVCVPFTGCWACPSRRGWWCGGA